MNVSYVPEISLSLDSYFRRSPRTGGQIVSAQFGEKGNGGTIGGIEGFRTPKDTGCSKFHRCLACPLEK